MDPYREKVDEEHCQLMTLQEFRKAVIQGCYNDYDGYGHPVKDGMMNPDVKIYPSTTSYPKSATHIAWFNK